MISFSPHIILQSDRGFCWCCCLFLVFKFQSWNGRSERLSDFLSPTQQSRAGTSTIKSSLPNGSMVKNLPANAGEARDVGSVPGSERSPGVGNYDPLQYSCLENPHGQRSLVGYSLWSCKVGHDWASAHTHTHTHTKKYAFDLLAIFFPSYHTGVVMCVHGLEREMEREGEDL